MTPNSTSLTVRDAPASRAGASIPHDLTPDAARGAAADAAALRLRPDWPPCRRPLDVRWRRRSPRDLVAEEAAVRAIRYACRVVMVAILALPAARLAVVLWGLW